MVTSIEQKLSETKSASYSSSKNVTVTNVPPETFQPSPGEEGKKNREKLSEDDEEKLNKIPKLESGEQTFVQIDQQKCLTTEFFPFFIEILSLTEVVRKFINNSKELEKSESNPEKNVNNSTRPVITVDADHSSSDNTTTTTGDDKNDTHGDKR